MIIDQSFADNLLYAERSKTITRTNLKDGELIPRLHDDHKKPSPTKIWIKNGSIKPVRTMLIVADVVVVAVVVVAAAAAAIAVENVRRLCSRRLAFD